MAWFADLAGKAENLLNNLDEQTGAALRNHNVIKQKNFDRNEFASHPEPGALPFQKKRIPLPRTPRSLKKVPIARDSPNNSPNKKSTPVITSSQITRSPSPKGKTLPHKKPYTLNHCPKTLVGDVRDSELTVKKHELKNRRHSLPGDLEGNSTDNLIYRMENLEVENSMLKNELNVMNREVTDLLDRLRKTEDELYKTNTKLESAEVLNHRANLAKECLTTQLEELKNQIQNLSNIEITRHTERNQELENEISVLNEKNKDLAVRINALNEQAIEKESAHIKLEADLRHDQATISCLQTDLAKANEECKRLEKDWETYKHRVKTMLGAKDKEIKALQDGLYLNEDTKILMEQIDELKVEREMLSQAIGRVRAECEEMKQFMGNLTSRQKAAERVVAALRDALKDERAARNRAEAQCSVMSKELKAIQMETGQTIAGLRAALREKETELNHIRDSTTSVETANTSALNVADYDVSRETLNNEKVYFLSQKLIQRQAKVDALLADNNMLRIQLEKLECKYKEEKNLLRAASHSVVNLQDSDRSKTRPAPAAPLVVLSRRMDVLIRKNPIFRIFVIFYMIGLHFWVLTVLFANISESYNV